MSMHNHHCKFEVDIVIIKLSLLSSPFLEFAKNLDDKYYCTIIVKTKKD